MSGNPENIQTEKSIAVLPFVNMSADPENEYFSDGITEEIINALTKIEGLRVTARTSAFAFKGKNIDVRTIGRQLNVASILEGSVRKGKEKVRITAQLIRSDDGSHLWSEKFDRELADIFAVQDEISLLIADQVRENFGHFDIQDHLVEATTEEITAYNLYLKGRYHELQWHSAGFFKAIEFYDKSIAADPTFAHPYYAAGMCYTILGAWAFMPRTTGMQKAARYLDRGVELNNNLASGHFVQAVRSLWGEWQFADAHRHLSRALAVNPAHTESLEAVAEIHTANGDFEKAAMFVQKMLSLNPLSPNHYYTKGNLHYLRKEYEKAIECMDAALKIDPGFAIAFEVKAACYILLGDYQNLETQLSQIPQAGHSQACRLLFRLLHKKDDIALDLEEMRAASHTMLHAQGAASFIPWHLYLQVYLGNIDTAFAILEESIQNRMGQLINFRNDPFLMPIREDRRFRKLVADISSGAVSEDAAPQKTTIRTAKMDKAEATAILSALTTLLTDEKPFLDPALSLKSLADQLNIHPNKLSWLINEYFAQNFNEFINGHRLETFMAMSRDPANSHLSLLGLAFESGFNSKTVFNAFFKKATGMTPSAWLKSEK